MCVRLARAGTVSAPQVNIKHQTAVVISRLRASRTRSSALGYQPAGCVYSVLQRVHPLRHTLSFSAWRKNSCIPFSSVANKLRQFFYRVGNSKKNILNFVLDLKRKGCNAVRALGAREVRMSVWDLPPPLTLAGGQTCM